MKLALLYLSFILSKKKRYGCYPSSSSSSSSDRNRCNYIFSNSRCKIESSSSSSSYSYSDSSSSEERVRCPPPRPKKKLICFEKDKFKKEFKKDTDQSIRLIQEVIAQGVASSIKLAQGFTNEIISHLGCGIRSILKISESRLCEELNRVELNILEIIKRYSNEILHEVDELVTTTNNDLLDNIVQDIKNTNTAVLAAVSALPTTPLVPPAVGVSVDLIPTINIVNTAIAGLISDILALFKKATATELGLLNRILVEKKHRIIRDVTHELHTFREFLNTLFAEIQTSESKLICSTFDQSSKKLILELDNILNQIGQNIISIIKGCNTSFRLPLAITPVDLSTSCVPLNCH